MGKIFDALQKSSKEEKNDVSFGHRIERVEPNKIVMQNTVAEPIPENTETVFLSISDPSISNSLISNGVKDTKEPLITGRLDKNLVVLLQPESFEAEQFKMLRTNILFPASGKAPRTIMITSSTPHEGKSFMAANLAISIAQNIDEHVLLIDCDIRRPVQHALFGFGDTPGLSDYLSGDMPLSSLFVKTQVDKLTILPGGKSSHNPAELLSSRQMADLLEEVKNRYPDRYIILDSSPPLLTSETSAVAKLVDGIVAVVRCGRTSKAVFLELIDSLDKEKILGIVMNHVDIRSKKYYGYGKYSKYYRGSN